MNKLSDYFLMDRFLNMWISVIIFVLSVFYKYFSSFLILLFPSVKSLHCLLYISFMFKFCLLQLMLFSDRLVGRKNDNTIIFGIIIKLFSIFRDWLRITVLGFSSQLVFCVRRKFIFTAYSNPSNLLSFSCFFLLGWNTFYFLRC